MKKMIAIGVLLVMGTVVKAAGIDVRILNSGNRGRVAGRLGSRDGVQRISCYVTRHAGEPSRDFGYCLAIDSLESAAGCFTSSENLMNQMAALGDSAAVAFEHADGVCTSFGSAAGSAIGDLFGGGDGLGGPIGGNLGDSPDGGTASFFAP